MKNANYEKFLEKQEKRENTKIMLLLLILFAIIFNMIYSHSPCPSLAKGFELDKKVEDQHGNPLVGATVILYNHPNGMVIAQGETGERGWCNFTELSYGHYFLWVSYGGITDGEWVWITENNVIVNTLTLPAEELGHGISYNEDLGLGK